MRECCSGCNELREKVAELAHLLRSVADMVDLRDVGDDATRIARELEKEATS